MSDRQRRTGSRRHDATTTRSSPRPARARPDAARSGPAAASACPPSAARTSALRCADSARILGTETPRLVGVLVLTVASVALVVVGPRLLGQATDIIVERRRRATGSTSAPSIASCCSSPRSTWRRGRSRTRRRTSSPACSSARCSRLRESVEHKINRLPLSYIDRQSRGDLLSRVTNDIDNLVPEPAADDRARSSRRCSR